MIEISIADTQTTATSPKSAFLCNRPAIRPNVRGRLVDAFDVEREPESIRESYGDTLQARQLLIARRLVERGVRFVQVWHGKWQPWDNHDKIEENHRPLAGE